MDINSKPATDIATPEERVVKLEPPEVTKKVACPFLGSAVAIGALPVRNESGNPLAKVEDVVELGNRGGGDLGKVLGFFARGNHGKMRGPAGRLDRDVPLGLGLFSLELPGSQGSHAGHSGILQEDPNRLDSGRFSDTDFERLEALSRGGFIKRSDIARFIAGNIERDPHSELFPLEDWIEEAVDFSRAVIPSLRDGSQDSAADAEVHQSVTRITGGNHLLASAGEFGLLLAFLHNSPRTHRGLNPAFSMEEITVMFRDKKLPAGWEEWKKTSRDWIFHTIALAAGAAAELGKRKIKGKIADILD